MRSEIHPASHPDWIKEEIQFFLEMLKTPNIDQKTIAMINDTIKILLNRYNNPTIVIK